MDKSEYTARDARLMAAGILIPVAVMTVSAILLKDYRSSLTPVLNGTFAFSVLLCVLNPVLTRIFKIREAWKSAREDTEEYDRLRRDGETLSPRLLRRLRFIRRLTDALAVLYILLGLGVAFCMAGMNSFVHILMFLFMSYPFMAGLSQFRTIRLELLYGSCHPPRLKFARLYDLAWRAACENGCRGHIELTFMQDVNASIICVGQTYRVNLGIALISYMTEEELYAVLLHEFGHYSKRQRMGQKEADYAIFLNESRPRVFMAAFFKPFYSFPDTLYMKYFGVYRCASAIYDEYEADDAAKKAGEGAMERALTKLHLLSCYEYETPYQNCCSGEKVPVNLMKNRWDGFFAALPERKDFWMSLIDKESLSRSFDHPTLRMRLDRLGTSQVPDISRLPDDDYGTLCREAMDYLDKELTNRLGKRYDVRRRKEYLSPLSFVTRWEKEGRPLREESYGDVISALLDVDRRGEAYGLCEQAINELPRRALYQAYRRRGEMKLNRYDDSGIRDLYEAIDIHGESAGMMEVIERYCCRMGLSAELETARQKSLKLDDDYRKHRAALKRMDKKDRLIPDTLPESMLEKILSIIADTDDGSVEEIYYVKKLVAEDASANVLVLHFDVMADPQLSSVILHRVRSYLDTLEGRQYMLFDMSDIDARALLKVPGGRVYAKESGSR